MSTSSLRLDIEGLRAVAILLVLAFHAGLPLPGGYVGVDVFFVISGFLITNLLAREYEATGKISLAQFYARRGRRLLPAATVVLLGTCVASACFAAKTDRGTFGLDIASAAAYVANWSFAARAVDYLAEDVGRSPVLHFWSLSVEEQFYLVWPGLIIGAQRLGRRMGWSTRATLLGAIQLVLLPSLAWAIYFTREDPQQAFFITTTRLWELGIGAMLALLAPGSGSLPRWTGSLAAWLGAACILLSAFAFDHTTSWPGYHALVPTIGAALIIYGGTRSQSNFVARLLSLRAMVWLGGISYAIYLWHWPILVAGQDWFRLTGVRWGVALAALSLGPALLSHHFLENPIRFSSWLAARPQLTLSMAGNLSLAVVVAGFATSWAVGTQATATGTHVALRAEAGRVTASPRELGAGTLGGGAKQVRLAAPQKTYGQVTPDPAAATRDLPRAYKEGCQAKPAATEPIWCKAGDPSAKRTVAIVGDSKILQYYEALDAAGTALGLGMHSATMSSCPFTDAKVSNSGGPYVHCSEVTAKIMKAFEKDPPFAVVTSQHAGSGSFGAQTGREGMVAGLVSIWTRLRALGVEVVVVLDNPRPKSGTSVYECMLEHPTDQTQCAFSRKTAIERSAAPVQLEAASKVPGVHVIDLAHLICPTKQCAPVIGDVLIYRQGSHITNTYARSMAPALTRELAQALSLGH